MNKIKHNYIIGVRFNGMSLEKFFSYYHVGKEKMNSLIYGGHVFINGKIIKEKQFVLIKGDEVLIITECNKIQYFKKNINVIYEDENMIIVNKPKGILIHPDGNSNETLLNAVYYYLRVYVN